MPRLSTHRKQVDKVEVGSLDKRIIIYTRSITPINDYTNPNFLETLTNPREVWASIEHAKTQVIFDAMNVERTISDKVYMRYQPDYPITSENWFLFDNNYYKMITVENLQNRNDFLEIYAMLIGDINKAASLA